MEEVYHVGEKIKVLRHEMGFSAKVLASQAGISSGMLSQLEKGSTQGSVETLRKIAKVLNTTIAALFADEFEEPEDTTHESFLVVRKDQRKKISFPDPLYKCELLVPDLQGEVECVLVELEPQRITNELLPHTRGGEEIDMVLSGMIAVQVGEKCYLLEEGDTIRFNPKIPHKIENKTDQEASYISIITPPSF
jgi:transcriptional regulator with XRE-family HTH domain